MQKYYYQESETSPKVYVSDELRLVNTTQDLYSLGKRLSGEALPTIIRSQVESGALPKDSTGIYIVLTSSDVYEEISLGGAFFCSEYCGYHLVSNFTSGERFYYAMVGNARRCMNGCGGYNYIKALNGDATIDAMTSVIAHEVAEVVSDPEALDNRAWNADDGAENGDICAETYGEMKRDSKTRASYNYESPSGRKFAIQTNFDPELQACAQKA
jgi:hypothetical protein